MKAAFNVKSARLDTLTIQLFTDDLSAIGQKLQQCSERFGHLRNMPFTLDLQNLSNPASVDLGKLIALFARYQLRIIAIRHPDIHWASLAKQYRVAFSVLPEEQAGRAIKTTVESFAVKEIPPQEPEITKPIIKAVPTVVIDHTIRTGQQVYAEQTDLIILGLVSEGAEIIADGNIHVYGPLRGRALAGAGGNKNARIFAQSMQAELVSVAGIYRLFDQLLPDHLHRHPVQVYLQNERLVISTIQAN